MAKRSKVARKPKRSAKEKGVWRELTPEEVTEYKKSLPPRHEPPKYLNRGCADTWLELNNTLDRIDDLVLSALKAPLPKKGRVAQDTRDLRQLVAANGSTTLTQTLRGAIDSGDLGLAVIAALLVGGKVYVMRLAEHITLAGPAHKRRVGSKQQKNRQKEITARQGQDAYREVIAEHPEALTRPWSQDAIADAVAEKADCSRRTAYDFIPKRRPKVSAKSKRLQN